MNKLDLLKSHMEEMRAKYSNENSESIEGIIATVTSATERGKIVTIKSIDDDGNEVKNTYMIGDPDADDRFVTPERFAQLATEENAQVIEKFHLNMDCVKDGEKFQYKGFIIVNSIDFPVDAKSTKPAELVGRTFETIISIYTNPDSGKRTYSIAKAVHRPDIEQESKLAKTMEMAAKYGVNISLNT
jgi:hypothetical protein